VPSAASAAESTDPSAPAAPEQRTLIESVVGQEGAEILAGLRGEGVDAARRQVARIRRRVGAEAPLQAQLAERGQGVGVGLQQHAQLVGRRRAVVVQQAGLLGLRAQLGHRAAGGGGIGETGPIPLLAGGHAVARGRATAAPAEDGQQHHDHDG
jgi:hypothetical protein